MRGLLRKVEEFGKYIMIAGFKDAKIENVEEFFKAVRGGLNVETQFFDAKLVATWRHLYFAALNALTAFKNKRNVSRSLAMETMLYASAQRQIKKAMGLLGIKVSSREVAVLAIGNEAEAVRSTLSSVSKLMNARRDDSVLKLSKEKTGAIKEAFGISDVELKAIVGRGKNAYERALINLIVERMAILATQR